MTFASGISQSGASVIVIHENGAVHKDQRLRVFDKIVEIDGKKISTETSDHDLNKIFQATYPKVNVNKIIFCVWLQVKLNMFIGVWLR